MKIKFLIILAAVLGLLVNVHAQKPPALPAPAEIQFTPNYGNDASKVAFWWNDGWIAPGWDLWATRDVDPNGSYCFVQPVGFRFIFGYNAGNGTYSIAPAKFIIVDMANSTDDPCTPDLQRRFVPLVWHVKLVPSGTFASDARIPAAAFPPAP